MSQTSGDPNVEHLLTAVTDALLADDGDLDTLVKQYEVSRGDLELIRLIRKLHAEFLGVRPSRQFARRLRQDLLTQGQPGLISRIRFLPARVQIAAGVAVLAGFMLLSRRRLSALNEVLELVEDAGDAQEATPTQA